jgi:predicted transposase YdaD
MNIIKNSMDRASLLYDGGLKEGLAKGEAKANLEIARKMKAMGDSVEKIHAVTGLSPDTVEGL